MSRGAVWAFVGGGGCQVKGRKGGGERDGPYLERQPGRDVVPSTCSVVDDLVVDYNVTQGELAPDRHVSRPGEAIGIREREAERIAIVTTLLPRRAVPFSTPVEDTEEVQLLPGVVLVDVVSVAVQPVGRVLDAVDAPRHRVLRDADVVPQAPAQKPALGGVVIRPRSSLAVTRQVADIEGPHLRVAGGELQCGRVHVL